MGAKPIPELAQKPRLANPRVAENRHELRGAPLLNLTVDAH